jgi:hypothetical protein
MPIRKFRDVAEMEGALWRQPGDPALFRAIAEVWSFAAQTVPRHFPPGVYKHRSIEDAEKLRAQWEEADFRALWARRGTTPEEFGREKSASIDSGETPRSDP